MMKLSPFKHVFGSLVFLAVAFGALFVQQPAPQPTPVAIKIDAPSFDKFVGQYEDAVNLGGLVFSFFREGEKFYLRVTNQDKIEILPSTATKFFTISPGGPQAEAEFVLDTQNRVTSMIWRQAGAQYDAKR